MSLYVKQICREGIAISSSVSVDEEAALGFPATIANLMGTKWKEAVAQDPYAQGIEIEAVDGRPHPMMMMLGQVQTFPVTFRVYNLGITEAAEDLAGALTEFHLWLGEDEDGNGVVCFNTKEASEDLLSREEIKGCMSVLRYAPEDFEELLELLSQDFTVQASQDEE